MLDLQNDTIYNSFMHFIRIYLLTNFHSANVRILVKVLLSFLHCFDLWLAQRVVTLYLLMTVTVANIEHGVLCLCHWVCNIMHEGPRCNVCEVTSSETNARSMTYLFFPPKQVVCQVFAKSLQILQGYCKAYKVIVNHIVCILHTNS